MFEKKHCKMKQNRKNNVKQQIKETKKSLI